MNLFFFVEINDKYHCLHSYAIKINDDFICNKEFRLMKFTFEKSFNLNLGILHIALSVLLHTLCTYVRACVVRTLCVCVCMCVCVRAYARLGVWL